MCAYKTKAVHSKCEMTDHRAEIFRSPAIQEKPSPAPFPLNAYFVIWEHVGIFLGLEFNVSEEDR